MKFALETHAQRTDVRRFAERLVDEIEKAGGKVVDGDTTAPDIVLAAGGDGTMLNAVRKSLYWDVPVMGFNLGTLGFLTEAEPSELASTVGRLVAGRFEVAERITVTAEIGERKATGLNDVVVEKIDSTRLVHLELAIDGGRFATYRADGLVIATPTGSTAYSFSAGGPLVDPRVEALVMTPVASHSLFDRSLVLPASSCIEVTVRRDRAVKVNVDKVSLGVLEGGETVTVSRGERPVRFVTLGARTFSQVVRDKFDLD
ncbi:MAG: NAD(+)/NADH kinase [Acidimicrobiia bacterium]